MGLYIVDSSVFNKLYLNENGREKALKLFEKAALGEMHLKAPNLLYYEVISTAQYYKLPIDCILKLLDEQILFNLTLVMPTKIEWNKAIEIIQYGHTKSGFPSIYDSIFHAIAIVQKGILVTSDKKHFIKTKKFGHITMLDDLKI